MNPLKETNREITPDPETGRRYAEEVKKMAARARAWRSANPGREAVLQFNYPPNVCLIATVSDAVAKQFLIVNEAGMELLRTMGPMGGKNEMSVMMIRIALEEGDL